MSDDRVTRWLKQVFDTRDQELSCTECFEAVSAYVELELAGEDAGRSLPAVSQHLGQCTACREEYEVLRDLRRQEEDGTSPSIDDLRHNLQ